MNTKSNLPETSGKSRLVRPRYSPGLMLQDDDLTQAVDYARDLNRLMFKALLGCGVICGFELTVDKRCGVLTFHIGAGIALDCYGDPIHVPDPQAIPFDPSCGNNNPTDIWVIVRRREYCCAPRDAVCMPEDDESTAVCTRVRDGFEIRLVEDRPECACACPDAPRTTEPAPNDYPPAEGSAAAAGGARKKAARASNPAMAAAPPAAENEALVQGKEQPVYADPKNDCYREHYAGSCACGCNSDWVVLGRFLKINQENASYPQDGDHSVRRFIRPVLMRDPLPPQLAAKTE